MSKLISGDNKKLKTRCEFTDTKKAVSTGNILLKFARSNRCLGLSANQLDIMERVCIARVGGKMRVFIDPHIMGRWDRQLSEQEGCLSFPGIRGDIWRPEKIEVSWMVVDNWETESKSEIFEYMDAIILEHEIDHLNGIRCIDKMIRK